MMMGGKTLWIALKKGTIGHVSQKNTWRYMFFAQLRRKALESTSRSTGNMTTYSLGVEPREKFEKPKLWLSKYREKNLKIRAILYN